jgi:hypothetical protein
VIGDRGPRLFVLIMSGRSGSSALMAYLNQIPDLICFPEVLASQDANRQIDILNALVNLELEKLYDPNQAIGYGNIRLADKTRSEVKAVGFKVKYGDIHDLQRFVRFCDVYRVKVIYLTRLNLVRAALSRYRAELFFRRCGDYTQTMASQSMGPVEIRFSEFDAMLEREEIFFHSLNDLARQFSPAAEGVSYEELTKNPTLVIDRVATSIGSEYRVIAPTDVSFAPMLFVNKHNLSRCGVLQQRTLKLTPQSFREAIVNHGEFIDYYKGTKHSAMLYD